MISRSINIQYRSYRSYRYYAVRKKNCCKNFTIWNLGVEWYKWDLTVTSAFLCVNRGIFLYLSRCQQSILRYESRIILPIYVYNDQHDRIIHNTRTRCITQRCLIYAQPVQNFIVSKTEAPCNDHKRKDPARGPLTTIYTAHSRSVDAHRVPGFYAVLSAKHW